jgi:hypothetical protein
VIRETKVIQVRPDRKARREILVKLVQQARKENRVFKEYKVPRVRRVTQVITVFHLLLS